MDFKSKSLILHFASVKFYSLRASYASHSKSSRGIEWSLRALARMQVVCLFLCARAVVKFFLRALRKIQMVRNINGE